MAVDHDRLFKELISTFFEEFMMLFFPEIYEEIDFNHIKFLSQEVFTDVIAGKKYNVDILVETKVKGEDGIIIIHVEPQAYQQEKFNERMFIYFSRLFEKYRRKIIPIAFFSYDFIKDEPSNFSMTFSDKPILDFNYLIIELKKQNWRNYLRKYNPVAAALLGKMGYNENEKVEVKKEFFRILIRLELDEARTSLITGFFESYLQLNEMQEQQFMQEVRKMNQKESDKIMEVMTSYEKKGIEKGIQEVAKRMLEKGKPLEEIMEMTGLDEEQIKKL